MLFQIRTQKIFYFLYFYSFFFPVFGFCFCSSRGFVGLIPGSVAEMEGLAAHDAELGPSIPGTPRTPPRTPSSHTQRFSLMIGVNPRGSLTELRSSNTDLLAAGGVAGHRSLLKTALESNYSRSSNPTLTGSTPPSPSRSWKLYRGVKTSSSSSPRSQRQVFLTPQQQRRGSAGVPTTKKDDRSPIASTDSTPKQQRRRAHSSAGNDNLQRGVSPLARISIGDSPKMARKGGLESPRPVRRSISPLVTPRSSVGDISPRVARSISPLARDQRTPERTVEEIQLQEHKK